MEAQDEHFDLAEMIEMAKKVSEQVDHLEVEMLTEYLQHYVRMLKTLGKLVEIGFSDINSKAKILKDNKQKFTQKGEKVDTIQELVETEVNLGLGKVNGSNNYYQGIPESSEFYKHVGSARTVERVLRFLMFVERIMENLYNNREESLTICIKNAYDKELGPHHGFLLRGAVKGIVYLLPDRDTFLNGLVNEEKMGKVDEERKYALMKEQLENSEKLTRGMHILYR